MVFYRRHVNVPHSLHTHILYARPASSNLDILEELHADLHGRNGTVIQRISRRRR